MRGGSLASVRRMVRDGLGVLPDGLLASLRRKIRFETGSAAGPPGCGLEPEATRRGRSNDKVR